MAEFQENPNLPFEQPESPAKNAEQNFLETQNATTENIQKTGNLVASLTECGEEYSKLMQQFDNDISAVQTYLLNNGNEILSTMEDPNAIRNEVLEKYVTKQFSRKHPQYSRTNPPLRGDLEEPWEIRYPEDSNFEMDPVMEVLPRLDNDGKTKTYLITPPLGAGAPYFIKFHQVDPMNRPLEGEFRRLNEYHLAFAKQPVLKNGSIITELKEESEFTQQITEDITQHYPVTEEERNKEEDRQGENAYRLIRNETMQNIQGHEEIKKAQKENMELPAYSTGTEIILQVRGMLETAQESDNISLEITHRPAELMQSPGLSSLKKLADNLNDLISEKNQKLKNSEPDKELDLKILRICTMFYDLCADILKAGKNKTTETQGTNEGVNEQSLFTFSEEGEKDLTEGELFSLDLDEEDEIVYEESLNAIQAYIRTLAPSEQHFSFDQQN